MFEYQGLNKVYFKVLFNKNKLNQQNEITNEG